VTVFFFDRDPFSNMAAMDIRTFANNVPPAWLALMRKEHAGTHRFAGVSV
jgi:hypothetical protein